MVRLADRQFGCIVHAEVLNGCQRSAGHSSGTNQCRPWLTSKTPTPLRGPVLRLQAAARGYSTGISHPPKLTIWRSACDAAFSGVFRGAVTAAVVTDSFCLLGEIDTSTRE
jgi:hypothetical protein